MPFTDDECRYLKAHAVGRLATVARTGDPDISSVFYRIHEGHICIGGLDTTKSIKYRNVLATRRIAFVVDDADPHDLRGPRGVKLHGRADIIAGPGGAPEIRILPEDVFSWGLNHPDEPFSDELEVMDEAGCSPV
jgi:PPOX class F420-dependent enzyme/OxyR family protein